MKKIYVFSENKYLERTKKDYLNQDDWAYGLDGKEVKRHGEEYTCKGFAIAPEWVEERLEE